MKSYIRHIMLAVAAMLALGSAAQNTRSGYFLDDYTYRFQMNPAYGNSKNFVAMPALGNFDFGVNGTLGVSDVLYNVDGRTTTFLNPGVSAAEVMSNISDMNSFGFDTRVNILAFGFKGMGGYNTFSVGVRADMGLKVPGGLFSLLKEGVANETYNVGGLKGFGRAYAEVQIGHSHQIFDGLRIGANLKVLVGAGNAKIDIRHADLVLGVDDWAIQTDGDINVSMQGFKYKTELSENTGNYYVNGADVDDPSVGGIGFAVDLGAVYQNKDIDILKDFEFSIALQDLGFINWKNNMLATTGGMKKFNTDKHTFNVDDDAPNSFDNEWDQIKKELSALYELEDRGDQGSTTTPLGATLNVGALYTFPYYNGLKFGLLNTTRMQSDYSWTEFRLSANVMPCKVFDASVNVCAGTFGAGFGWMANLHCPGFNLFLGMDRLPSKLAKQGVPLNSNAQFNLGINFLF